MYRCPITYEISNDKYSKLGLKLLSPKLKHLLDFPFTPKEQIKLAAQFAAKLSIQGVQPKLSVILNVAKGVFEIVEKGGTFILKPPHHVYEQLPENEDLTMKLAKIVHIEVPFHGMIYNIDGSLSYFIKRFDRSGKGQKVAVEDFSQLLGFTRDTKYESSMEKIISVIDKYCTFPVLEKLKLFRIVIFNFLVGNEDMHLKNFSLIRWNNKVELSPAYDLVNTTIVLPAMEEIALPIRGKKSRLSPADLIHYLGEERLKIGLPLIVKELKSFEAALIPWKELITISFLSLESKDRYHKLIESRWKRLSE